jgi:hypothetical protein
MAADMTSPTHSSRRINRIATARGARSYLEIGVQHGRTFRNVQIRERVGVDPTFGFDVSSVEDSATHLFPMTSDEYFASLSVDDMFDIAFIDGLHTFEQTYRDFCNVLIRTHRDSVVIIDDTRPVDVYSSLRDPHEAVARRAEAGGSGNAWHGDVYKVVFAIREFHPSLEYVTIMTGGNPQTLVWRPGDAQKRPQKPDPGKVPDTFRRSTG